MLPTVQGTLVSYYHLASAFPLKGHDEFHVTRSTARNFNGRLAAKKELAEGEVADRQDVASTAQHVSIPRGQCDFVVERIDPTTSHGEISYFRVHKVSSFAVFREALEM